MTTVNLNVGDILENKETRRKGKKVKVLSIDEATVLVENVSNADNAVLNSVGKKYKIKANRILNDYKVVDSFADAWRKANNLENRTEDVEPVLMPRPEEQPYEVTMIQLSPDATAEDLMDMLSDNVPMTPEEEEEAASLAVDNHADANDGWAELAPQYIPQRIYTEDDDSELTPDQEADLHNALKSVGYYKLPDEKELADVIQEGIDAVEDDEGEEIELTLEEIVSVVLDTIRSYD